jgi:hypothetical protein
MICCHAELCERSRLSDLFHTNCYLRVLIRSFDTQCSVHYWFCCQQPFHPYRDLVDKLVWAPDCPMSAEDLSRPFFVQPVC